MKAIVPEAERFKLYDNVIAKDIQAIAELGKINGEEKGICVGMYYDDSIDTNYVFQLMKIYANCVKGAVTIYIDTNRKLFNQLKKDNPSLNLKKVNMFNRSDVFYIMRPGYLKSLHKDYFSKERFYSDHLISNIWYAYYEPEDEFSELEDLL